MKKLTGLALLLLSLNLSAKPAADYLPADADLDPAIPTPESVLGWDVGDWHVSHDRLVQYMQEIAKASPRVSLIPTGRTYEQRPLMLLSISSEEHQGQLEELRQAHLEGDDGPLVVWLGYSVHGNEPSGSNAALLAAYYLAASRSPFVTELLEGSVILLEPSINPDGLQRFANWANQNAGRQAVSDPVTRQHNENWVNGRTNHYWFDLNRDWLPLVHLESQARLKQYHQWLPHVLTDHHEQGGYPGFFFQPGVPSRQNPLTPTANLELTRALARYHSAALDESGQPHFTEDAYDDFYYGKGSTYPDINGSVGILFEQRAIRGQALATSNGIETFPLSVANQFHMTLSTLKGSWELRDLLKTYQRGFHNAMLERADSRRFTGWIVGDGGDRARAAEFLSLLDQHQIEYQALAADIRAGGASFQAGRAWVIPAMQRQFGLLEAMMEQRTEFEDDTFYDVSAWTLPLAYNLPYATVANLPSTGTTEQSSALPPAADAVAWAIPWNQMQAAPLLQKLLNAEARVRTAIKPFTASALNGQQAFERGTLLIQAGIQDADVRPEVDRLLREAAQSGIEIHSLMSTLTTSGPDLGARHFKLIEPIKPLVLGGKGTSAYDVGEIWFLLDYRLGIETPVVELPNFKDVDLGQYTHLLLAEGSYSKLGKDHQQAISAWVRDGGVLVGINGGARWIEKLCFSSDEDDCEDDSNGAEAVPTESGVRAYEDFANDRARQVIGGAIVNAVADLSHPMLFGYTRPSLPIFRRGTTELTPSENPYSSPLRYSADPLMAGFIGPERLDAIKGQPALIAEKHGEGLVVRFANTPLFRGFWRGTERLFINALYFGQAVEATRLPRFAPPPAAEMPRFDD